MTRSHHFFLPILLIILSFSLSCIHSQYTPARDTKRQQTGLFSASNIFVGRLNGEAVSVQLIGSSIPDLVSGTSSFRLTGAYKQVGKNERVRGEIFGNSGSFSLVNGAKIVVKVVWADGLEIGSYSREEKSVKTGAEALLVENNRALFIGLYGDRFEKKALLWRDATEDTPSELLSMDSVANAVLSAPLGLGMPSPAPLTGAMPTSRECEALCSSRNLDKTTRAALPASDAQCGGWTFLRAGGFPIRLGLSLKSLMVVGSERPSAVDTCYLFPPLTETSRGEFGEFKLVATMGAVSGFSDWRVLDLFPRVKESFNSMKDLLLFYRAELIAMLDELTSQSAFSLPSVSAQAQSLIKTIEARVSGAVAALQDRARLILADVRAVRASTLAGEKARAHLEEVLLGLSAAVAENVERSSHWLAVILETATSSALATAGRSAELFSKAVASELRNLLLSFSPDPSRVSSTVDAIRTLVDQSLASLTTRPLGDLAKAGGVDLVWAGQALSGLLEGGHAAAAGPRVSAFLDLATRLSPGLISAGVLGVPVADFAWATRSLKLFSASSSGAPLAAAEQLFKAVAPQVAPLLRGGATADQALWATVLVREVKPELINRVADAVSKTLGEVGAGLTRDDIVFVAQRIDSLVADSRSGKPVSASAVITAVEPVLKALMAKYGVGESEVKWAVSTVKSFKASGFKGTLPLLLDGVEQAVVKASAGSPVDPALVQFALDRFHALRASRGLASPTQTQQQQQLDPRAVVDLLSPIVEDALRRVDPGFALDLANVRWAVSVLEELKALSAGGAETRKRILLMVADKAVSSAASAYVSSSGLASLAAAVKRAKFPLARPADVPAALVAEVERLLRDAVAPVGPADMVWVLEALGRLAPYNRALSEVTALVTEAAPLYQTLREALAAGGDFKPTVSALVTALSPVIDSALKARGVPVTTADVRFAVSVLEDIRARGADAEAVRALLEEAERTASAFLAKNAGGVTLDDLVAIAQGKPVPARVTAAVLARAKAELAALQGQVLSRADVAWALARVRDFAVLRSQLATAAQLLSAVRPLLATLRGAAADGAALRGLASVAIDAAAPLIADALKRKGVVNLSADEIRWGASLAIELTTQSGRGAVRAKALSEAERLLAAYSKDLGIPGVVAVAEAVVNGRDPLLKVSAAARQAAIALAKELKARAELEALAWALRRVESLYALAGAAGSRAAYIAQTVVPVFETVQMALKGGGIGSVDPMAVLSLATPFLDGLLAQNGVPVTVSEVRWAVVTISDAVRPGRRSLLLAAADALAPLLAQYGITLEEVALVTASLADGRITAAEINRLGETSGAARIKRAAEALLKQRTGLSLADVSWCAARLEELRSLQTGRTAAALLDLVSPRLDALLRANAGGLSASDVLWAVETARLVRAGQSRQALEAALTRYMPAITTLIAGHTALTRDQVAWALQALGDVRSGKGLSVALLKDAAARFLDLRSLGIADAATLIGDVEWGVETIKQIRSSSSAKPGAATAAALTSAFARFGPRADELLGPLGLSSKSLVLAVEAARDLAAGRYGAGASTLLEAASGTLKLALAGKKVGYEDLVWGLATLRGAPALADSFKRDPEGAAAGVIATLPDSLKAFLASQKINVDDGLWLLNVAKTVRAGKDYQGAVGLVLGRVGSALETRLAVYGLRPDDLTFFSKALFDLVGAKITPELAVRSVVQRFGPRVGRAAGIQAEYVTFATNTLSKLLNNDLAGASAYVSGSAGLLLEGAVKQYAGSIAAYADQKVRELEQADGKLAASGWGVLAAALKDPKFSGLLKDSVNAGIDYSRGKASGDQVNKEVSKLLFSVASYVQQYFGFQGIFSVTQARVIAERKARLVPAAETAIASVIFDTTRAFLEGKLDLMVKELDSDKKGWRVGLELMVDKKALRTVAGTTFDSGRGELLIDFKVADPLAGPNAQVSARIKVVETLPSGLSLGAQVLAESQGTLIGSGSGVSKLLVQGFATFTNKKVYAGIFFEATVPYAAGSGANNNVPVGGLHTDANGGNGGGIFGGGGSGPGGGTLIKDATGAITANGFVYVDLGDSLKLGLTGDLKFVPSEYLLTSVRGSLQWMITQRLSLSVVAQFESNKDLSGGRNGRGIAVLPPATFLGANSGVFGNSGTFGLEMKGYLDKNKRWEIGASAGATIRDNGKLDPAVGVTIKFKF